MTRQTATATATTRSNLNDWVRGTTTYKVLTDKRILFIAANAEGFNLYVQRYGRSTHIGTYCTEAEARNAGDRRIKAGA